MNATVLVRYVLFVSLTCWHAVAVGQDQYLCIADQATGFKYLSGTWQRRHFRVEEERYVLRRGREDDLVKDSAWVLTRVGEDLPTAWCADDFGEYGWLTCGGIGINWRMNKNTLRFMYWYFIGYVEGNDTPDADTPLITIGKCASL